MNSAVDKLRSLAVALAAAGVAVVLAAAGAAAVPVAAGAAGVLAVGGPRRGIAQVISLNQSMLANPRLVG